MYRAGIWVGRSIVLALLAGYGLAALVVARSSSVDSTVPGRLAQPSAASLASAASERLAAARAALNDRELTTTDRLSRYRDALAEADGLLVAALRRQPIQPRAVARLAALRFELDPPRSAAATAQIIGLVEFAASMAPRDSRVQFDLGSLLLRMGMPVEAMPYLHRSVEFDASMADDAVSLLREHGMPAPAITSGLPDTDRVIAAVEPAYAEDGLVSEFTVMATERLRRDPGPITLDALATALGRLDDPAERLKGLLAVGRFDEPALEAARLASVSRAMIGAGQLDEAIEAARRAHELRPESPERLESLGAAYLASDRYDEAIGSYREAIGAAAAHRHRRALTARYFRMIGDAELRRGRDDRAHDAYTAALRHDPDDRAARERLRSIERRAGAAGSDAVAWPDTIP